MHVYIIFAHPSRESFGQAVLEAFARGLEEGGIPARSVTSTTCALNPK